MEKGCGKFSGFVRKPVENTLGGLKNPGNMREKFSTDFLAHVENLFCGPWNVPLSRDVFPLPLGQGEHPEAEQEHPRHQQVKALGAHGVVDHAAHQVAQNARHRGHRREERLGAGLQMGGGQLVDVVQGGADEQPVAQAVEGAAKQHAPEGIGPQPQEQALQAHEDGRAHHQHPQGEPPAQAHHQQQEGDFQQSAPAHEDAVPLGRHPGVGHKVGEEGALAAGGDVQQQPEKQQADVGLVLEQLPQVQLLLARGLPGGLGVGLPGEEGEEHGDKGQQAGHPEGGGHPHRGQQKGDEEAANHKEEGAHAAQQAVVEPQLVGVAHQNVFGVGAHGASEEVHHRHQAEEQPGGDGQPGGNQGDKGKEQAAPQQHQDEHLPQGAHAVADHAPKGHRGNGEDRGQGV